MCNSHPVSASADLAKPCWLHWVDSCPSTNTWAIESLADLSHGDVVFTRHQTAGRGQHGRTWYAPEGVLTASIILDRLSCDRLSGFSLAAGLAVIGAIEDLLPDQRRALQIKWPNDIYLQGRKLSGVLCESVLKGKDGQPRVVVGVGLNRYVDWAQANLSETLEKAISLDQVSPLVPAELVLLERLRHHLLQVGSLVSEVGLAALLPELRDRDLLLNRSITFQSEEEIVGLGAGIDAIGRLLIRLPDGAVRAFISGRVVDW